MKILITGRSSLASLLHERLLSTTSCRIEDILRGEVVLDEYDVFINYAHVGFKQVELLEYVFNEWKNDTSKLIINISSRAAQPNISSGYMYAAQKAALNHYADNLTYNCLSKQCRITTLNLGLMDSKLPSLAWGHVYEMIKTIMSTDVDIPDLTMQDRYNYKMLQHDKGIYLWSLQNESSN
jgi:short-subunit dehydrogenase involved in D-alanine esterification of teichoic acids